MKRTVCILLISILIFSLTGCGGKIPEAESIETTIVTTDNFSAEAVLEIFLEDWINLLVLQERRLAQENYTLDLILNIEKTPTWENYVYAQTACEYTCEMFDYLTQNEAKPVMKDSDYQVLIDLDMDLDDVQAEFRTYNEITLPNMKRSDSVIWREYYLQNLLYGCFDENTMTMLLASANNRREINRTELKYWFLVNNYIMLELPEEYAQKLWRLAEQNAPSVIEQYEASFTSSTETLNEINRTLNQQEECLLREEEILTAWNVLLDEPAFSAKQINGLPTLIRFPESVGVNEWDVQHYWKNGEDIQVPEYQMEMDTIPNCMSMERENTSLEAYQQYVVELRDEGLIPSEMSDTTAVYALSDGGQLMIYYEESVIHISVTNSQVCFAPLWYVHAIEQRN